MAAGKHHPSPRMLELVARRFRMLGEPQRLRILQILGAREKTVNQIVAAIHGNQSNISRHLQALFHSGLVERRRSGNSVYYSIADPVTLRLCDLVCQSAATDARQRLQWISGDRSGTARK